MNGFNLIEILITLAIIAILAAASLPTYSEYLIRAKRLEAESMLGKIAIAMEHYYIEHNTYLDSTFDTLHISYLHTNNNYQFIIQSATDNAYLLAAKPINHQAEKDIICGILMLNSLGEKSISGPGKIEECW